MSNQTSQGRSAPRWSAPVRARSIVALAFTALIAACGGGSDDSSEPDSAQRASLDEQSVASAQALVAAATLEAGAGWVTVPATSSEVSHGPSVLPPAGNQVYYVDSASTATTSAGTLAAPWKTLQEVQARWSTFQNGDAILLKCGSVWRETLQVSAGASRPNLLIGAYGNCSDTNRPVIKGSALVDKSTGWQRYGVGFNHTYAKTFTPPDSTRSPAEGDERPRFCDDAHVPPVIPRLFLNGQPLTQARFPNKEDNGGKEFAALNGVPVIKDGASTFSDTSFYMGLTEMNRLGLKKASQPEQMMKGALVHIRTQPWEIETRVVTAFDATTGLVTLDKATVHPMRPGAGYILEGKAWLLGKAGQWAYDGGKLYWWPPANKAPKDVVGQLEASHIEAGILAKNVDGLKIERIRFEQHRRTGIDIRGDSFTVASQNISIKDIEAVHPAGCGLSSVLADRVTVQDSKVIGAGKFGLHLNPTSNATVIRNSVVDTGLNNRAGGSASAITVRSFTPDHKPTNGSTNLVEENQVLRAANTGIFFSNDVGTTVNRNTVIRPCVRLTDCGGIYSFTNYIYKGIPPAEQLQNINDLAQLRAKGHGATVSNNLVVGAVSNVDGSHLIKPAEPEKGVVGKDQAVGIYLDELTTATKVIGNTVANTEVGIFLHLARFNTIENNTVVNVSFASFMAGQDTSAFTKIRNEQGEVVDNSGAYRDNTMRGNEVLNNRFFSHRAVDPQQRINDYDYDAKPVYAQLWQNTQVSPQTFFTTENGPANVSRGNTTYTTSNVQSKTWRTDIHNLLTARHGGVWGIRQNHASQVIEPLGLTAWQQKSGATLESETSPLAFKQFLLAQPEPDSLIKNGNFVADTSRWTFYSSQTTPSASLTRATSAPCSAATPCGRFVAHRAGDFMASDIFSVTANELYLLRYTATAGVNGAVHRGRVRNSSVTSTNYNPLGFNFLNFVAPGETVRGLTMAPGQEIQVEQFFRASESSADAVLSITATHNDSEKTLSISQVSLTPISATAMPTVRNQAAESITLVNASDSAVTRTCSDWQLSGANNCNLIDGETRAVIGASTQVTVPARSTKVLFFHRPEWIDN